MMTPKMKEDFCTQILGASRQLFLSGRISEICREKGTQKQLEFILELLQAELTLRDENRRKRLIKRAGFPTYKTFEGYSYHCVQIAVPNGRWCGGQRPLCGTAARAEIIV